jgi:hypothetical protein
MVSALIAGTSTVVASSPVTKGFFSLALPAAADVGTLYDLAVAGGNATYDQIRLAPLFPANNVMPVFSVKTDQKTGTISGTITDACDGKTPIVGATVSLLQPPNTNKTVVCTVSPGQCIVVATTATDNTGAFPLIGTVQSPAPFNSIPIDSTATYYLQISAPGYDTFVTTGTPSASTGAKKGGTCVGSSTTAECNVSLTSQILAGIVSLTAIPFNSQSVLVTVFAEQHGTHNVVSSLSTGPLIIRNTQSQIFDLKVPSLMSDFDLYAQAIDLFQGSSDPYNGHTILVQADVNTAGNTTVCQPLATTAFVQAMECVGHGSVTGGLVNALTSDSVILSKQDSINHEDVQLLVSGPGQVATPIAVPSPGFSFCAPGGDTYDLQRYRVTNPAPGTTPIDTPTPAAVGTPQAVSVAIPTSTASPCPTTCFYGSTNTSCPSFCSNTVGSPL